MAKEFAKPFYNSAVWKRCRAAFIAERMKIDGGMCQDCGERLGEEVHHEEELTPENIRDPDVSLNPNLLRYLCRPCHKRRTFGWRQDENELEFDENGQPIPPLRDEGEGGRQDRVATSKIYAGHA